VSEAFAAPLVTPVVIPIIFVLGISCLLLALLFEFLELRTGLQTIPIETSDAMRPPGRLDAYSGFHLDVRHLCKRRASPPRKTLSRSPISAWEPLYVIS
jgi:hypothetical protein